VTALPGLDLVAELLAQIVAEVFFRVDLNIQRNALSGRGSQHRLHAPEDVLALGGPVTAHQDAPVAAIGITVGQQFGHIRGG